MMTASEIRKDRQHRAKLKLESEMTDAELDKFCQSGEPDERDTVYGMICGGLTNDEIETVTALSLYKIRRYRKEIPDSWRVDMVNRHTAIECNFDKERKKRDGQGIAKTGTDAD